MSSDSERAVVNLIAKRLIARQDVMAIQAPTGEYRPSRGHGFTRESMTAHIRGEKSYGHYLLNSESQSKVFAYDLDLTKTGTACPVTFRSNGSIDVDRDRAEECNPREVWADPDHPLRAHLGLQLRYVAESIAYRARRAYGFDVAISYSGNKGLHVYVLAGLRSAADCRGMCIALLDSWIYAPADGDKPTLKAVEPTRGDNFWRMTSSEASCVDIELFPKQDHVEPGEFGNLMRLPLGRNMKTGNRSFFVDLSQPPTRSILFAEDDPEAALAKGSIRD